MRKPSTHSTDLLRSLAGPALSSAGLLDVISRLAHSREPAVLPWLVPFVLARDPAVAAGARQAALLLLQATPVRDLAWLDQTLRGGSRFSAPAQVAAFETWSRLRPEWLEALSTDTLGQAVLLLASLHPSGYMRQEAVRLLDLQEDGAEVPFLLLRLNDWVRPVEQVAQAALLRRLVPAYAPHLVRCLYLIEQLSAYRRRDHAALLSALHRFLGGPSCRQALLAGLSAPQCRRRAAEARNAPAPDRLVQRHAFQLLLTAEGAEVRSVVLLGLDSSDMLVRVWAARAARKLLYGKDLATALGQARKDRAVPVRMEAVYAFVSDHPELQTLLLDPCKSIRETVRFYIRKHANLDFAALYRQALAGAAGATLPVVLLSLGETGQKADAAQVVPYIGHPQVRVRKAALQALGQLDGAAYLPVLYAALVDPHPGVKRTAWEALRSHAERLDPGQLATWLPLRRIYESVR